MTYKLQQFKNRRPILLKFLKQGFIVENYKLFTVFCLKLSTERIIIYIFTLSKNNLAPFLKYLINKIYVIMLII